MSASASIRTAVLALAAGMTAAMALSGCGMPSAGVVAGSPTWSGATLSRLALGAADLPTGVEYDRIIEKPGQRDGAGGPGPMLSRPQGCANALTDVIAASAERGPGSAVKYVVGYDGARIMVTLLSWNLDLAALDAEAERCAEFEAFFDPSSAGIPITTTELPGVGPDALAYQQTMTLGRSPSSVYMAFQNVGPRAVFAIAYPTSDPTIEAKAELPQTFLGLFAEQIAKIRAS